MYRDFKQPTESEIQCDICIVGAGAAGISMALEFVGKPVKVILVESGDFETDSATQSLYKGETMGVGYSDLDVTRLRYFGGSTNHWGGYNMPYSDLAIRRRPWVPYSGWPLKLADLQRYYRRAFPVLGLREHYFDTPFWERATHEKHGNGINFDPALMYSRYWQLAPQPMRFGSHYRTTIGRATNVEALLNANVVDIAAAHNAASIDHISLASLDGKRARLKARAYVLACGGLENPRILLNANTVMTAGLGNARDQVGRYFMDHPGMQCGSVVTENAARIAALLKPFVIKRKGMLVVIPALHLTPAIMQREGLLEASLTLTEMPPATIKGKRWERLSMIIRSEQAPNPNSRVRLTNKKDALGQNRIHLTWNMTLLDIHSVRRMGEVFSSEMARLGLGNGRLNAWVTDGNPKIWPYNTSSHHHIGTTRMSSEPKFGVVDPNCRVHGISNLFVAGSSVFPTSGMNNPTLTIVALAIRLADHLKEKLHI